MSTTMPTRVDGDLFDAAKSVGAIASRSAAQQISHWARIGRELEASPATSLRDIQRVLAGETDYDSLGERGQAVVRASWDEQMADRRESLDLAAEFAQAWPWSEADERGGAVLRNAGTAAEAADDPAAGAE
ncbi:MAG: TA system antitoxin ParD family protein [Microcella pacifica]